MDATQGRTAAERTKAAGEGRRLSSMLHIKQGPEGSTVLKERTRSTSACCAAALRRFRCTTIASSCCNCRESSSSASPGLSSKKLLPSPSPPPPIVRSSALVRAVRFGSSPAIPISGAAISATPSPTPPLRRLVLIAPPAATGASLGGALPLLPRRPPTAGAGSTRASGALPCGAPPGALIPTMKGSGLRAASLVAAVTSSHIRWARQHHASFRTVHQ